RHRPGQVAPRRTWAVASASPGGAACAAGSDRPPATPGALTRCVGAARSSWLGVAVHLLAALAASPLWPRLAPLEPLAVPDPARSSYRPPTVPSRGARRAIGSVARAATPGAATPGGWSGGSGLLSRDTLLPPYSLGGKRLRRYSCRLRRGKMLPATRLAKPERRDASPRVRVLTWRQIEC